MFKLILLLTLSSCSFFISKIDTPLEVDPKLIEKAPEVKTYCSFEKKVDFQLVGAAANSQSVYLEMIKKYQGQLDFLDHFALWNLMQLSIRPDQSSATSRFQVLVNKDGKSHYFDFFSESSEEQYPYLFGIEWILKKFNKQKSLESYAAILNNFIAGKIKISKDFEGFLLKHTSSIKNDPELSPYYFRGSDVLKENETSPTLDYAALFKIYRKVQKEQKIIVNTSLTQFVTAKGNTGSCNYDFNLYDNSIFLIDKVSPITNIFGLSVGKSAFLASSSQKLEKVRSLKGLPLFNGESKVRSSAVCMIENNDKKVWAFSSQSRDPGQHLFHLVRYGLPNTSTASEVNKLIRHSRHLFLSDPVRLIIESARSSEEQVENLLKLNLPIYNADKLGNIWAYTHFQEGSRFIIDERNPGAFKCQ